MIRRPGARPTDPAPPGISRRSAIALGALGLTGGWSATRAAPGNGNRPLLDAIDVTGPPARPDAPGAVLRQPPVLASRRGRLRVDLTAGVRRGGQRAGTLGFNGGSPGPTLRVHPGDELAVRLINHLDEPTNLHTHGLRVSPQHNGDNPFLHIDPATSFDYLFRIPDDHPTGTFWYHPHPHGFVADQVFAGLFGALLVDPPAGRGRELSTVEDRVLLISDITLDADGRVADADGMDQMMGRQGEQVLVNGQRQPTIPAAPGAPQRWRIINACASRVLAIRLQDHDLVQIAADGTFLPVPTARDRVVLAPGNRADVLIRPTMSGRYDLTTEPYRDVVDTLLNVGAETDHAIALATMTTAGPPATPPSLPRSLPSEKPHGGPVSVYRHISFGMSMGGTGTDGMNHGGMSFTIDGRTFNPARDDLTIRFGATEEWTITNDSSLAHPFHLHTWPFTVLATSDLTPGTGVPQDVVLVPANGWVRLRIPFTTHSGRSVFHCHTLDHEDGGMMATLNVRR